MAYTRLLEAKIDWSNDKLESNTDIACNTIKKNVDVVLSIMGGELVHDLQKHIEKDFYDEYQPKSYPRRKNHTIFGPPLDDTKNFDTVVKNNVLTFDYHPLGFHTGKIRDTLNFDPDMYPESMWDKPIKPKPVHGDDLINRLEKGEGDWRKPRGATWTDSKFPKRPFWSNFVSEENNGKLIRHFNKIVGDMDMTDGAYAYKFTKASYRDLSFGGEDFMDSSAEEVTNYDDLPF